MPHLNPDETFLLDAVLDRIIPADDLPSAVGAGVRRFIDGRFAEDPSLVDVYRAGLRVLEAKRFSDVDAPQADEILSHLEGHPAISAMISHALEGYYAGIDSVGAQMVGFRVTA